MNGRAFASASRLAGEIRDRHIGCLELLDFYLARARRHNPTLRSLRKSRVGCVRSAGSALTSERCLETHHLQRTRFEQIAERKLRRRQLTEDGNIEITGRDLRESSPAAS